MRLTLALISMLLALPAIAGSDIICPGDKRLGRLEGLWVQPSLTGALARTRSWADSLAENDSSVASVRVGDEGIYFNLSWHEEDAPNGKCVRLDSDKLWARPNGMTEKWLGPYVRIGPSVADEGAYYLSKFFVGCFESHVQERWCLSPTKISVNGKDIGGKFQMDISEGPLYGTGFQVKGKKLPFLVFVPRANGWAVFEDDWASSDRRVHIDSVNGKPWRLLTRSRQQTEAD